jgi:hypothetical protein
MGRFAAGFAGFRGTASRIVTCSPSSTPWSSKYRELRAVGKTQQSCARSLPQALTKKIEANGVKPMSVRKKARAGGIVLSGILLGLVLALPGCNANWPPIGSQEEVKLLAQFNCPSGRSVGGTQDYGCRLQ